MRPWKDTPLAPIGLAAVVLTLIIVNTGSVRGGNRDRDKDDKDKDEKRVVIVNPAAAPVLVREVDNPARQPFQSSAEVDVANGFEGQNGILATVPSGKLLVIEYIGVEGFGPSGQNMAFRVNSQLSTSERTPTEHFLVTNPRGLFGGQNYFEVGQSLRLYAGPDTTVNARVDRDQSSGTALGRFTLSGYLVDCGTTPGTCPLP